MEIINNFFNSNYKKIIFVIVVVFVVSFVGAFIKKQEIQNIKYVTVAGKTLKVDLALTKAEQRQGLSGRKNLLENEGMLFVFEKAEKYSFWMKNMNFPIDIIWFTPSEGGAEGDLRVVYIKKNAKPESYPENFTPSAEAKYVLEVVSGFSDKNNLKEGDSASLLY